MVRKPRSPRGEARRRKRDRLHGFAFVFRKRASPSRAGARVAIWGWTDEEVHQTGHRESDRRLRRKFPGSGRPGAGLLAVVAASERLL